MFIVYFLYVYNHRYFAVLLSKKYVCRQNGFHVMTLVIIILQFASSYNGFIFI